MNDAHKTSEPPGIEIQFRLADREVAERMCERYCAGVGRERLELLFRDGAMLVAYVHSERKIALGADGHS